MNNVDQDTKLAYYSERYSTIDLHVGSTNFVEVAIVFTDWVTDDGAAFIAAAVVIGSNATAFRFQRPK